jgi:5-methylcytosine-specific restriction endonuclease McrA
MTKKERIYNKFNGLCAYTGKPLGSDWQIDHVFPKCRSHFYANKKFKDELGCIGSTVNDEKNLFPCLKIVNHYKRGLDLEGFRGYLSTLHIRLSRIPKNPRCEKRAKYKEYMLSVAESFGITPDNPFSGKFYFEILNPQQ